jgi:hypothetical protein
LVFNRICARAPAQPAPSLVSSRSPSQPR